MLLEQPPATLMLKVTHEGQLEKDVCVVVVGQRRVWNGDRARSESQESSASLSRDQVRARGLQPDFDLDQAFPDSR